MKKLIINKPVFVRKTRLYNDLLKKESFDIDTKKIEKTIIVKSSYIDSCLNIKRYNRSSILFNGSFYLSVAGKQTSKNLLVHKGLFFYRISEDQETKHIYNVRYVFSNVCSNTRLLLLRMLTNMIKIRLFK